MLLLEISDSLLPLFRGMEMAGGAWGPECLMRTSPPLFSRTLAFLLRRRRRRRTTLTFVSPKRELSSSS